MTEHLDKVIYLLEAGSLIRPTAFSSVDNDSILDGRDSDPFDSEWMNAFNKVESVFKKSSFDKTVTDKINKVREFAFKKTYEAGGAGELADYVCDDFELIAKALIVDSDDRWLASLLNSYLNGVIPSGNLTSLSMTISQLIEREK